MHLGTPTHAPISLDYDALADTSPMSPPPWSCARCGDDTGRLHDTPRGLLCGDCAEPEDVLSTDVVLP